VPKFFSKCLKLLGMSNHERFVLLRQGLLWPVHVLIAVSLGALIRLASRLTGHRIRVACLKTYSFGALVQSGPWVARDEASQWAETGGRTWIFLHGPYVNDNPFVLRKIVEASHETVTFIRSRILTFLYSRYCPGHMEEPLFRAWRSGKLPSWASPITIDTGAGSEDEVDSLREAMRKTFRRRSDSSALGRILVDRGYLPEQHEGIVCFNVRDS